MRFPHREMEAVTIVMEPYPSHNALFDPLTRLPLQRNLREGVQQGQVEHHRVSVQRYPLKELHTLQPEGGEVWGRHREGLGVYEVKMRQ